jgi:hypothetical protein
MSDELLNILFSIFIGIIVGYILFILNPNKYVLHGPNSKDIISKIYKIDNKCYKLEPIVTICPSSISML